MRLKHMILEAVNLKGGVKLTDSGLSLLSLAIREEKDQSSRYPARA